MTEWQSTSLHAQDPPFNPQYPQKLYKKIVQEKAKEKNGANVMKLSRKLHLNNTLNVNGSNNQLKGWDCVAGFIKHNPNKGHL